MIGMINCGGDNVMEFYACARHTSLFKNIRKPIRQILSYNADGRVFVNGVPKERYSPSQLWDTLLKRTVTSSALASVASSTESLVEERESTTIKAFHTKKGSLDSLTKQISKPSIVGNRRRSATE